MKQLQEYLNQIALSSNIATSSNGGKLEQKISRKIKEDTTQLLLELFAQLENENIIVKRTSNGVGIALDNEKIGFIPLEISLSVKNLDYDIDFENEEYENHLKEMQEKAQAKAQAKAKKIASDTKKRQEKQLEKEKLGRAD